MSRFSVKTEVAISAFRLKFHSVVIYLRIHVDYAYDTLMVNFWNLNFSPLSLQLHGKDWLFKTIAISTFTEESHLDSELIMTVYLLSGEHILSISNEYLKALTSIKYTVYDSGEHVTITVTFDHEKSAKS